MGLINFLFGKRKTTNANELRSRLSSGIVTFSYWTKDGYKRNAIGTRNLALVQRIGFSVDMPKGHRHNPNAYYDFEKKGWRSFSPNNIISIR